MPLGTKVGLGAGDIVLNGGPSFPKIGAQPATFRPMSIVAKESPSSTTAEHLLPIWVMPIAHRALKI